MLRFRKVLMIKILLFQKHSDLTCVYTNFIKFYLLVLHFESLSKISTNTDTRAMIIRIALAISAQNQNRKRIYMYFQSFQR